MMVYLEDLIHEICKNKHVMPETDIRLFKSFDNQIKKSLSLTDKQVLLAQKKIKSNQLNIEKLNVSDLDDLIKTTKYPIRNVDRSRWIKLVENPGSNNGLYIGVRFLYKNSIIKKINQIANMLQIQHVHKSGKVHYFPYSERSLVTIIEELKPMHFELDDQLYSVYEYLTCLNKKDCCIGIDNYQLCNAPDSMIDSIKEELGPLTEKSVVLYKDRSIKYGIEWFNKRELERSKRYYSQLSNSISKRKNKQIAFLMENHDYEELIGSLNELKRFPVLCVIPQHDKNNVIRQLDKSIKKVDSKLRSSYIFKLSSNDTQFNEYVEENISQELTSDTDVVYTLDTAKHGLASHENWMPSTVVVFESTKPMNCRRLSNLYSNLDLIMYCGKNSTRRYGIVEKI